MNITSKYLFLIIGFIPFFSISQILTPGYNFIDSRVNDTTRIALFENIRYEDQEFKILDPIVKASLNTGYARGYNDGAVWKGKGATVETHFGFQGRKGILSYTFQPVVYVSQNSDFDLSTDGSANLSPFAYQYSSRIDHVQQFGSESFTRFHPGQSEVKLSFGKFSTSVSTQNFVLGPSLFNPIIMGNQAGGFPHLRIGTDPVIIKLKEIEIIDIEAHLIYGLLSESDYFDNNTNNDQRYFNGLFLGLSPSFARNLKLGFNRAMYKNTQFFEPVDLLSPIKILDGGERGDSINTNDTFDQLASLTMDWSFPSVGFRAYAEFAKNDFTGNKRRTLVEPEHSRAYTIGFEKIFSFKNDQSLSLVYEHTNLSKNHTYLWRPTPPFYAHGINRQGYTQDGQILGAGIGPGSNSDQAKIMFNTQSQQYGMMIQRIEFNKDYLVTNVADFDRHDVEYSLGLFHRFQLKKLEISSEFTVSENLNRYYVFKNDATNIYLSLAARYKL